VHEERAPDVLVVVALDVECYVRRLLSTVSEAD
jgi:hypothetical protein